MAREVRPALPQLAADPTARRRALDAARDRYTYQAPAENPLQPIAVAGKYPFSENYGLKWALPYLPQLLRSVLATQPKKLWYKVRGWFGPFDKMEAFADLFSSVLELPPPSTIQTWRTDGAFARKWIDGPNPLTIRRVPSLADLADRMVITDAEFQGVMGGTRTIADEIAAANLYVIDYELLERSLIPPEPNHRDSRWRDKYLPAPVVLLCQRPGSDAFCDLVPVAIRIDQPEAEAPNLLYLRDGTPRWTLAKLYADVADFNLQAMSSHIFRHHYIAEPFAVTTRRQLAPDHPVFVLLEPHIRHTIMVNHAAWTLLKKPGSVFDTLYAGELPETREIMIRSYDKWTVREQAFDADIVERGVDGGLSQFPWRDDGRLWKEAIDRFVDGYLRLYYASDADVVGDSELQQWWRELGAPDGGNLRGLLPGSALSTVAELTAILQQFLFTAGPAHAAVHYPQTDYFTYVPMIPGAAYLPPPGPGEPITESRIYDTLPPFQRGADQFQNNQIAYYRFDRFGDYADYPLGRVAAALPLVQRLSDDLQAIEAEIANRNHTRPRPYPYMLPSLVPNSINI